MSEYVWSTQDFLFANGIFDARLLPGQVWWADDPLVKSRPEFFSATPPAVLSTTGRPQPGITPVRFGPPEPAAAVPVVDDAQQAVAAVNALAETNPVIESVVQADAPVRRGPGRPRRG